MVEEGVSPQGILLSLFLKAFEVPQPPMVGAVAGLAMVDRLTGLAHLPLARPPPSPITVVLVSVLVLLGVIFSLWDCGRTRFKTCLADDVICAGWPPAGPPAPFAAD